MAHYDMLVIGSGPAGQKAAIQAAKVGKKVGIIERKKVAGGICINSGTIPSKSLREAVLFLVRLPPAQSLRRQLPGQKRHYLRRSRPALRPRGQSRTGNHPEPADSQLRRFHRRHSDHHRSAPHRHQAGRRIQRTHRRLYRDRRRHRNRPPAETFRSTAKASSTATTCSRSNSCPSRSTIVGGGVIGCEYACILATLGIPVVLVERRPRLLEFVDSEIIESLQYQMRNIGVTLRLNEEVVGVVKAGDQFSRAFSSRAASKFARHC